VSAREAALRRAARVKRWVAGGAVALTGVFSAVAANALPANHSSKAKTIPSAPAPVPDLGGEQQQQDPGLAPPAAPPEASSAGGGAVSGGS
jgi:hypothetical protein